MDRQVVGAVNRAIVGACRFVPPLGKALRRGFSRVLPVHEATVRGVRIKSVCPLHQVANFDQISGWDRREPEVFDWIDSFEPGGVFFDVGSSYGHESLYAALKPDGPRQVFAFDCSFKDSRDLATNIKLNGVKNIRNIFAAISDTSGFCEVTEVLPYKNILYTDSKYTGVASEVPKYSLDWMSEQFDVTPDYIKIDVDGPEHAIVRGMTEILARGKTKSLFIEINSDRDRRGITEILADYGFARLAHPRSVANPNNVVFTKQTGLESSAA